MKERPKTWADLETFIGVQRTVRAGVTQRDVERLTARHLRRWPKWARKFR